MIIPLRFAASLSVEIHNHVSALLILCYWPPSFLYLIATIFTPLVSQHTISPHNISIQSLGVSLFSGYHISIAVKHKDDLLRLICLVVVVVARWWDR